MDSIIAHQIIRDATVVALAAIAGVGYPIARAYAKRMDKPSGSRAALPSEEPADARMERVEQAIEAVALEVERMAEGQRFLTKLLADPMRSRAPDDVL